ncbi:MAG: hypothetical protein HC904_08180 [Blastochloris sp.]|nr:hypothetical protein [Blastochloris sp.]
MNLIKTYLVLILTLNLHCVTTAASEESTLLKSWSWTQEGIDTKFEFRSFRRPYPASPEDIKEYERVIGKPYEARYLLGYELMAVHTPKPLLIWRAQIFDDPINTHYRKTYYAAMIALPRQHELFAFVYSTGDGFRTLFITNEMLKKSVSNLTIEDQRIFFDNYGIPSDSRDFIFWSTNHGLGGPQLINEFGIYDIASLALSVNGQLLFLKIVDPDKRRPSATLEYDFAKSKWVRAK